MTEVTLWYPVISRPGSSASWPPEPAVGCIALDPVDGLTWVTSGTKTPDGAFVLEEPGDFVAAAVPFPSVRALAPISATRAIAFEVYSPHREELGARLSPILGLHAGTLGDPGDRTSIAVVEFPNESPAWLSFVSSGMIVFGTKAIENFLAGEARGYELVAHELAHLWFGVSLRAQGPAARWLTESFAEYYAWRALGSARGAEAADKYVHYAQTESAQNPRRIDTLDFSDELVYTRGALAVRALASTVGEARFDATLRGMVERHGTWSVAALFDALSTSGAPEGALRDYRAAWGI